MDRSRLVALGLFLHEHHCKTGRLPSLEAVALAVNVGKGGARMMRQLCAAGVVRRSDTGYRLCGVPFVRVAERRVLVAGSVLSPADARELASDLNEAADIAEKR